MSLSLDRHGNLFAAGGQGILKLSPAGRPIAFWKLIGRRVRGEGMAALGSVTIDGRGRVYVIKNTETGGYILRLSATGKHFATWGRSRWGLSIFGPTDLAIRPRGGLEVLDQGPGGDAIDGISFPGDLLARRLPKSRQGRSTDSLVLAVDPRGRVYLADNPNDEIEAFSANGHPLTVWTC